MKKLLILIAGFVITLIPMAVFATGLTLTAGGLGTTTIPFDWVVLGSNSLRVTAVATSSLGLPYGTGVSGHCVDWTSGNNLGDAGAACGSGGGGSTFATTSISATYPILWNTSTAVISTALSSSTLTASSPLTGSFAQVGTGGSLGIQQASGSQSGYLSSTDWTTFNNKMYSFSTTSASCSGNTTCTSFTIFGSSPITISSSGGSGSGLSTTTPLSNGDILLYSTNGAGAAYGVPTSTLTPSSPLTGSFTQIGSSGSLGCQTASGSQAGCLSSTDWTTFNNKGSGTVTSVTATPPLFSSGGTTPNITWTGIATTSNLTAGQLLESGGGAGVFSVATSSLGVTSPITFSGTLGAQVGGTGGNFACATCLTANQTITLSGAVSGSGSTAITTSYAGTLGNTLGGTGANSSSWSGFAAVNSGSWYSVASSSLDLPSSALQNTAVTAGSYTNTNLTVNAEGQITAASNGSGGSGITWPWTQLTNWATSTDATTTAYTAPAYFASSTLASQFPYASSTAISISSTLWAQDFESVLYADQFSGSDIGAKINTAYAALPSTGGTIVVPSGSYTFSTPINFGTQNKPAILQCASAVSGTTLTYNGSAATSTIINDFGTNEVTYGSGIRNCSFSGSNTASTTDGGIFLGGSNGAAGTVLDSVSVTGFGYGLVTGANTYEINVNNSTFDYNYTNLLGQTANNSGERMSFTNDGFLDGRYAHFASCLYLSTSAYSSATFNNSAFDDCAVVVNDGNLDTSFIGGHAENPDYELGNQYYYFNFATSTNNGFSQANINGMAFINDGTTTADSPYSFILSGMHTSLVGDTFDANNITLPSAIQMVNTGQQSLEASGIENVAGTGYTTFATSSEAFVVNQPAGTWTTSLSLASNLLLDDTAITTTDNGDEVIGTDWGWYIKGDSTHLTQIVGGSLMVGYSAGTPGGTTYPTNDILVAGNIGIASTTPWAALSIGSGAIVVQEASTSDYTTADVNVNFQNQQTTKFEMNANTTVNLYNDAIPGEQQKVIACQDTTGSRTLTWVSSTSLDWSGGTTPTVTATAKQCDVFSFIVTGATGTTAVFGASTQNF